MLTPLRALYVLPLLVISTAAQGIQSYRTENFIPPNLQITKYGPTEQGYLFFGPTGKASTSPAPLIMTDTNELVWQGPNGGPTPGAWDLHVQTYQGQSVLTYWTGSATLIGGALGKVHILDDTYREIATVCPTGLEIFYVNGMTKECSLDLHDMQITDRGTMLVSGLLWSVMKRQAYVNGSRQRTMLQWLI